MPLPDLNTSDALGAGLGWGLLASILIHAAAISTASIAAYHAATPPSAHAPDPPEAPQLQDPFDPPLPLGDDQGVPMRVSWLGALQDSPQNAPKDQMDQAALAIPSLDPNNPDLLPGAVNPAPTPSPASEPSTPSPAPSQPATAIAQELQAATQAGIDLLQRTLDALATAAERSRQEQALAEQAKQEALAQNTQAPAPPTPPSPASPAGAQSGPVAEEDTAPTPAPGNPADRESQAVTTNPVPITELGAPVVAQGVTVNPVRPRFGPITRLTASPRNPVLEFTFDATGTATKVRLIVETGIIHVDEPILNAAYRWTASGDRINALTDNQTLTVRMEIDLQ